MGDEWKDISLVLKYCPYGGVHYAIYYEVLVLFLRVRCTNVKWQMIPNLRSPIKWALSY